MPVRWWLQGLLMVASFWVAMVVALPTLLVWGLTAGLLGLLSMGLMSYGAARVGVDDGWFRAGRAKIELYFLADVEVLDQDRMREVSGPAADARAYLVLRPYVRGGVKIALCDPADPTPYWLVSSRRPRELAEALRARQERPGAHAAGLGASDYSSVASDSFRPCSPI